MSASEKTIGACTCPVCGSQKASLRVSSKGLSYVCCNTCNVQIFARSDNSDDRLRRLHIKALAVPADAVASVPVAETNAPPPVKQKPTYGFGAF